MELEILRAPVTVAILIITTVISVVAFYNSKLKALFVLHPYSVRTGKRWHTLFTSSLVHTNWLHLLFNMAVVYVFSSSLEEELVSRSEWGHLQLGVLYAASILVCSVAAAIRYRADFWYNSLGASGGAFAVFCGYLFLTPSNSLLVLPVAGQLPNIYTLSILIIGSAYSVRWRKAQRIDHFGHLVGGISGVAITTVLHPATIKTVLDHFTKV